MSLLDTTLGAYLIGVLVSSVIWGVTCSQVWHYHLSRPQDPRYIKTFVVLVWLFDSTQQILSMREAYHMCVTEFGNLAGLSPNRQSNTAQALCLLVVSTLVQFIYTQRIWKMFKPGTNRIMFVILAIILYAVELAASIWNAYEIAISPEWATVLLNDKTAAVIMDVITATIDTVISCTMCYLLYQSRTEFTTTNSMIQRIMYFTFGTNILTSLVSVAMFLMYFVAPQSLGIVALTFGLTRLYASGFMVFLNARPYMKHGIASDPDQGIHLSLQYPSTNTRRAVTPHDMGGDSKVHVHVHTYTGEP